MLSIDEVKHISALARIGLAKEDIPKYQHDLSLVLDYFQELEKLDTNQIEPIEHITGRENVTREDATADFGSLGKEKIIQNAPESKNGQVKVRSVF